jgi:gliding motility-associated-like protein
VFPVPLAADDSLIVKQGESKAAYVLDNDNMNGVLSILTDPQSGTVMISGDSIIYTSNADFTGQDYFEYLLCSPDCPTDCDTGRVLVIVDLLFIPNGFSPNGDGVNDFFVIDGLIAYPDHELYIINRWGDVIYKSKPYHNDWDGSSNTGLTIAGNHVTDGTYFYIFIPSPGATPYRGYIELRR